MSDRSDRAGQQLGNYHLLRYLGGGSFGDVYLGELARTRERVAVKVLHGRLTDNNDLKEFINEARTFRLKHPHILPLLDFGIASDDLPYLVMEYAAHGTLRDRHPKGTRVTLSAVVSYVLPLAEALAYAHEQHLIHRDVKPENVLLAADGRLLLSDFGIATVAQSSHLMDASGSIGGTLPYMAPEQLQGRPRPASDQYALAIVTYEWLTGVRPFHGTQVELLMQHATVPPPLLREYIPELSVEVEEVVLTALAKDPKARFATVDAFARALAQAAEPTRAPVLRRPQTLPPEPPPATPPRFVPLIGAQPPETTQPRFAPLIGEQPPETTQSMKDSFVTDPPLATPPPLPEERSRPRRSRKMMLFLASALLVLLLASASILWSVSTINTQHIQATTTAQGLTAQAHLTAPSVTLSTPTATPFPKPPSSVMLRVSAPGISPTSQGEITIPSGTTVTLTVVPDHSLLPFQTFTMGIYATDPYGFSELKYCMYPDTGTCSYIVAYSSSESTDYTKGKHTFLAFLGNIGGAILANSSSVTIIWS